MRPAIANAPEADLGRPGVLVAYGAHLERVGVATHQQSVSAARRFLERWPDPQRWATQPGMGKPDGHSERCGVDPAGLREEGKSYLRRSPLRSAHPGLPRQ